MGNDDKSLASASGPVSEGGGDGANTEPINEGGPLLDIAACVSVGWAIYKRSWFGFSLSTLLIFFILFLINSAFPFGGTLVIGPLMVGFYYHVADAYMEKPYDGMRLLQGFKFFIPLFVVTLLTNIFTTIGFALLIIPGIVVMGWYLMAYIFVIDKGYGFWQAMEASRELAFEDMVTMSLFAFAIIVLNVIGFLLLGIGALVTFPVTMAAVFEGYRRTAGVTTLFSPDKK